ncbi:MAG: stage 0 sporulation family protein [Oscillospiraceae bacterium]|nr:stage 0 sporulation family protein [Oscillospiraceae bacterium]
MDNYFTEKIAPKNKPENTEKTEKPTEKQANADKPAAPRPERQERREKRRHNNDSPRSRNDAAHAAPAAAPAEDNGAKVEIIGIRFKDVGKVYYFSPNNVQFKAGEKAIVETARGIECGEVMLANRMVSESSIVSPLKSIIRKATAADEKQLVENRKKEQEIMQTFAEKIQFHKLDMKPIDIDCTFDGSKILFYFTSDGRVDFRELVKDLAAIYRTRIELRQIGVRDEAKMLGGLGICGRPFCCSSFLGEFQPVSIKMAKEQSLSLNPTKISGTCGRLMCCLKYEQNCYDDFLRTTPKVGAYVDTEEGRGHVEEVNLLTGMLKIKLDKKPDVPLSVNKSEVKLIKDGQVRISKDEIKALKNLEDN